MPSVRDEINMFRYERNSILYSNRTLFITIIPTLSCNFRCLYCYESNSLKIISESTLENLKLYILKNIKRYHSVMINWFGGEPLLCLDVIISFMEQINKICKKECIPVISQMTTNGYYLTQDVFLKLYNQKILYYQVSLDGISPVQNQYRPSKDGTDSYSKVLQNLKDIKNTKKKNFQIGIRSNISVHSYRKVRMLIDILAESFREDKRYVYLVCKICDWGGKRVSSFDDALFTEEDFLSVEDELLQYAAEKGLNIEQAGYKYRGEGICDYLKNSAFILNADGLLYPCTLAIDNPYYSIGEINQKGEMILNDKFYDWVPTYHTEDECLKCEHIASCLGVPCPFHYKIEGNRKCKKRNISYFNDTFFSTTEWDLI